MHIINQTNRRCSLQSWLGGLIRNSLLNRGRKRCIQYISCVITIAGVAPGNLICATFTKHCCTAVQSTHNMSLCSERKQYRQKEKDVEITVRKWEVKWWNVAVIYGTALKSQFWVDIDHSTSTLWPECAKTNTKISKEWDQDNIRKMCNMVPLTCISLWYRWCNTGEFVIYYAALRDDVSTFILRSVKDLKL